MPTLTDAVNTLVSNTTTLQTTVSGRITDMDGKISSANSAKIAAETAKAGAEVAKGLADTAKTDAITAQTLAENAKLAAETAQGVAATAKTDALTAKAATETAKGNAIAAQAVAESAKNSAQDWATKTTGAVDGGEYSAKYHATAAGVDAGTATSKAAIATTKANEASASATAATSNAATSATNAANAVLADRYTKAETDAKVVELSPPATKAHIDSLGINAATLTGSLPAGMGGKVLQVLQTGWTSSSDTVVNGTPIKLMSLSITTQANSKVLVFMSTGQTNNSGASTNPKCYLSVDGVQFTGDTNHWFYGVDSRAVINMQGLSGALTAGTHTVEMWGGSYNGAVTYNYQTSQQGSLIVMEIGV